MSPSAWRAYSTLSQHHRHLHGDRADFSTAGHDLNFRRFSLRYWVSAGGIAPHTGEVFAVFVIWVVAAAEARCRPRHRLSIATRGTVLRKRPQARTRSSGRQIPRVGLVHPGVSVSRIPDQRLAVHVVGSTRRSEGSGERAIGGNDDATEGLSFLGTRERTAALHTATIATRSSGTTAGIVSVVGPAVLLLSGRLRIAILWRGSAGTWATVVRTLFSWIPAGGLSDSLELSDRRAVVRDAARRHRRRDCSSTCSRRGTCTATPAIRGSSRT